MFIKSLGSGISVLEKIIPPSTMKACTGVVEKAPNNLTNLSKHFGRRIEALKAYKNPSECSKLFCFGANGEISVLNRRAKSSDLVFLEHVKMSNYAPPKTFPAGANGLSKEALEQSNRLAKEVIPANEILADGFRYHGPQAKFNEAGINISPFKSGCAEITIIDRKADKKLVEIIDAFKARIDGKNLSEQEKMQELLKYTDEIFSVKKTGTELDSLVHNMHSVNTREVYLGEIANSGAGVCRHRSLMNKVLGDEIGLSTSIISGHYGGGGHAWNEITTKSGEKFLLDAMHRSIFDISNTSKSVTPQLFNYRIDDPKNADRLIGKYFDPESTVGLVYRKLAHQQEIKFPGICEIRPSNIGEAKFQIIPTGLEDVVINGHKITNPTPLLADDWVQFKSLGFAI